MGERDGGLIADLDRLLNRGVEPSGDGDLLARFRANGDHDAFATLVMRHGPMVRGVCRRLLRDANDADDAFQATFLVLARKGGGLRDPDRLGPWLYGVASRVAAKARTRSARRKDRPLTDDLPARDDFPAEWSDVLPILDAELAQLPSKQREVLVACLLGGASEQEAARSFGCPVGTVKSRLSRGRETLRARLVRRGIAPATALAAASAESFASSVSTNVIRATIAAASAKAEVAPAVAALMKGAVPIMSLRSTILSLAVAGGLGVVTVATAWTGGPSEQEPAKAIEPPKNAPDALQRQASNMREILKALRGYESKTGAFPVSAIYGSDGAPKLSWRVALLPYLNEEALYQEFHLDEPWDSPHNKALISRMPTVYETPNAPAPLGSTRFRGFSDSRTMFRDGAERDRKGVKLQDVVDGQWNTVFLAVAADSQEWTKPGELPFAFPTQTLPAVDLSDQRRAMLGMVDGSVRRLAGPDARPINPMNLGAMITRNGGEVVFPEFMGAVVLAGDIPRPEPKPVGIDEDSAAVQDRLRRIEEKLDQVLKRLDGDKP
ncbi:sigma-70 family RNA polymerase sigma factor [Paludisphaera rhizosphaerae]|uniref:sigma-70 family RNA polymerase sigma factor n=1 Tax=Paludisphaera rhizosphaerae TaxID=2711216 RepID=UPI0013ED27FC|nr:sigma-70 family RNA polymerase sigma factor [Paludisphaera rhizosphaerae]